MNAESIKSEGNEHERPPLVELLRKVMLAGIGAASLAQEEAETFIQKMIEKGELAEKEGRILMKDLREKRRQRTEEHLENRISSVVERLKIPTKSDLDKLSEKISELSKKVDEMNQ
jgi:polyhydroxyalkanoate synthesis regulator phasin